MKFHFVKRSKATQSFRVSSIMGKYDLISADVVERFDGEIPIEKIAEWKIGVIFGGSGTGKTLIAIRDIPTGEEVAVDYKQCFRQGLQNTAVSGR